MHRFEIFRAPIRIKDEKTIVNTIMAAVALHNWLMTSTGPGPRYGDDCPDTPAAGGMVRLAQQLGDLSSSNPQIMREELCKFFVKENPLPWQLDYI